VRVRYAAEENYVFAAVVGLLGVGLLYADLRYLLYRPSGRKVVFGSMYYPAYYSKSVSARMLAFCDEQETRLYGHRASVLKRAPKKEWYRDERVVYRWGQHKSEYGCGDPMPPAVRASPAPPFAPRCALREAPVTPRRF